MVASIGETYLRTQIKMLANDSNEGRRRGAFSLVIHTHGAVAELMAECPKCGAITSYGLELAWRLRAVSCSECSSSMQLYDADLAALRERLIEARVRIDALVARSVGTDEHESSSNSSQGSASPITRIPKP